MISPARRAAVSTLLAIERGDTTLAVELDRARQDLVDPRDRGLLLELTAGVLRHRGSLDALIEARSRRPVSDLDALVRTTLRLAVFQLEHTRVPPRAVVHEAVEIVKRSAVKSAAGFVNAVLRAVVAGGPDPRPAPPGPSADRAEQVRYLSTTGSFPSWLASRWIDRDGFDRAQSRCEFCNTMPRPVIRPRPPVDAADLAVRLRAAGVETRPTDFAPGGLVVTGGHLGVLTDADFPRFAVQEEASQLVGWLIASVHRRLARGSRSRLLDLCAAPGGKSLLLADALGSGVLVVACDNRRSRVSQLAKTVAGAATVRVVRLDGAAPLPFGAVFTTVVLDAPCSGLGTVRRDPDVKWSRTEADLVRFAARQRALFQRAAEAVAPGGALVYATCSSEPEENEAVVRDMSAAAGLRSVPVREFLDFATSPDHAARLASCVTDEGFLQTFQELHGLDAFFAAVLVRQEGP